MRSRNRCTTAVTFSKYIVVSIFFSIMLFIQKVNNLLIQQLLDKSKSKTLLKFFCDDLSGVTPSIAKRVIKELGNGFKESMLPSKLTGKQITRLVQLLRSVELFRPPDGSCLSPLGEYNLNLGIRKVIEPEIVATARDRPSAYEGHPFIVEVRNIFFCATSIF